MSGNVVVEAVFPEDGSVVDVRTFELVATERLVVFGPNGAGKSTFLRLLAGMAGGPPQVDSAYLPQHPYLLRGTAGWNLGLGLTPEEAAWAGQLARRFGLSDVLASPSDQLSGGERQRLALARTLAMPQPWILLDEPLAALDHPDRFAIAADLADLLEGRGAVIVTHDPSEAIALGTRMAVMIGGRILQEGKVAEVFGLPASDEVARAVGVSNVVDGIAKLAEGELIHLDAGWIDVTGVGDLDDGRPGRAFFGAESVTVYRGHEAGFGSAVNHWAGTVKAVEESGKLIRLSIDVGTSIIALLTPGSVEALRIKQGSPVTAAVKATAVRVIPT